MSLVRITILTFGAFNILRFGDMAEYNGFVKLQKQQEVQACEFLLADILRQTCAGYYNTENHKRADDKSESAISDPDYYYTYETYPEVVGAYPFRSKRSVSSILRSSSSKRKLELEDECCKKACTMDELLSYCD